MKSSFLLWSPFFCINSSSGSSFSLYLLFHLLSSFFCFSALSVLFCTVSSDYLAFKNSFFKSFVFSSVFASSICFFFSFSSFRTLILYLTVRFLAFPDFLYPYQIPLCVGLSFPPSVLYFPFLGLCFLPAVFSWFLSFVSSVFHYLPSELSLLLRFLFLGHHFQHLSVLFCCICLSRPRQFEAFHWDWHRDFSSQASGLLSLCLSWSFNYSGCSPPARSRWTFSKHLNRPDPPASPFFPPFCLEQYSQLVMVIFLRCCNLAEFVNFHFILMQVEVYYWPFCLQILEEMVAFLLSVCGLLSMATSSQRLFRGFLNW